MGKLAGKMRNAATKVASMGFTQEEISRRAQTGTHNGESMQQIYHRIMSDPNLERRETKPGVYDLVYTKDGNENIIGWMDQNRMMGEISQKGYDLLEIPRAEPSEDYDDYDDREIPEFDESGEDYESGDFGDE